jgi:hypothetical protein
MRAQFLPRTSCQPRPRVTEGFTVSVERSGGATHAERLADFRSEGGRGAPTSYDEDTVFAEWMNIAGCGTVGDGAFDEIGDAASVRHRAGDGTPSPMRAADMNWRTFTHTA